jgi:hypothetical protein
MFRPIAQSVIFAKAIRKRPWLARCKSRQAKLVFSQFGNRLPI